MQSSIFIEKPYEFVPAYKSAWLQRLLTSLGIHKISLRRHEGVVKHEVRGAHLLRESIDIREWQTRP